MDNLDGCTLEMTQEPVHMALANHRHDIPASLRELPQAAGHAPVPLFDEDALRGRESPAEFPDDPLLILEDPLELRLDSSLPGEESAVRRNQERQPLPAGHL